MQFGLKFLVMDPGYAPENRALIEENAKTLGIPIEIFESEIFKVVVDVEQSHCYLCARLRRGHLYAYARELGCNKSKSEDRIELSVKESVQRRRNTEDT